MRSKLTKRGYIIDKKSVSDEDIDNLKNELTVSPAKLVVYSRNTAEINIKLYSENERYICIPRFYGINKFGEPNRNIINETLYSKFEMEYIGVLRPHQQMIVDKVLLGLKSDGGGIIVSGCGSGKTNMAIYIACALKLRTLFVSHKEFLKNQIVSRIKSFTNCQDVGIIQQKKIEINNQFVVGIIHSLSMIDYDKTIFDDFGLIVIDEVHHMGARRFSQFYKKITAKYMLGISAEHDRSDKLYKIINWYMGPILHREEQKPNNMVIAKRYFFKTKNIKRSKVIYNMNLGGLDTPRMITNIVYIRRRNNLIANIINILHEQDKNILFLTGRLLHVDIIYNLLESNDFTKGHVGKYIGGMKQIDLNESATKQIILGTYNMAEEGLDIENLNVVILSTSKCSIKQSVGRILRKEIYIDNPIIIDIVDVNNSRFVTEASRRYKYYKSKEYITHEFNVSDYELDDYMMYNDIDKLTKSILSKSENKQIIDDNINEDYDVDFID